MNRLNLWWRFFGGTEKAVDTMEILVFYIETEQIFRTKTTIKKIFFRTQLLSSTEWTTNNTFTIIAFESRGKKANYLASRVQCSTDCLLVNKLYFRMPNKRENATTTIIKCSNRNARIYVRCTCIEIALLTELKYLLLSSCVVITTLFWSRR